MAASAGRACQWSGVADQHDVQVFLLEHPAVVAVGPRLLLRGLAAGHHLGRRGQHLPVHVAEGNDLHRLDLHQADQVDLAVPAGADQAHPAGLAFLRRDGIPAHGRPGQRGGAGAKEITALHGVGSKEVVGCQWLVASDQSRAVSARMCVAKAPHFLNRDDEGT
jgi:hypothetical protein